MLSAAPHDAIQHGAQSGGEIAPAGPILWQLQVVEYQALELPMSRRVIVLEFNELCPQLIDRFIGRGVLPSFARLRQGSQVYVTTTCDEHVQPWVQWVTFHLGVGQAQHKIDNLDEGHLVAHPAIWDDLAARGLSSFVFGTMNTGPSRSPDITIMPDPWSARVEASTKDLAALHKFISRVVQEHANPLATSSRRDQAELAAVLVRLGLRPDTMLAGASQIVNERMTSRNVRWKRASVLDRILWDVFEKHVRRHRDNLSIFFANSTAHFQHRYWRHMDPDSYGVRPSQADLDSYGGAIEHGYRNMDRIVERALRLADGDTAIVFASALSQEVNETFRNTAGQVAYRPIDFAPFVAWAGVTGFDKIAPLMSTTASLQFSKLEEARRAAGLLEGVRLDDGQPIIRTWMQEDRLYFMCCVTTAVPEGATIRCPGSNEPRSFHDLFVNIGGTLLDAHHAREGAFWIFDPRRAPHVYDTPLPLEQAKGLMLELYPAAARESVLAAAE
jgi:hypothetical protein